MKKLLCIVLLAAVVLACFSGCTAKQGRQVSCGDVITAYEEAGYEVEHLEYPDKDYGYTCYVQAEDPQTGDSIRFHVFETEDEAEAYAKENQWNWALWLYSAASFQPTWLTTKTYGCIEIEYDNADLYKPFRELVG